MASQKSQNDLYLCSVAQQVARLKDAIALPVRLFFQGPTPAISFPTSSMLKGVKCC